MAEEKQKYYPVRISLKSESDLANFKTLSDILVIQGRDESQFWAEFAAGFVEYNDEVLKGREFVDSEGLREAIEKHLFTTVDRVQLFKLRDRYLTEGAHYFSAPQSGRQVYRYDLSLTLQALGEVLPK